MTFKAMMALCVCTALSLAKASAAGVHAPFLQDEKKDSVEQKDKKSGEDAKKPAGTKTDKKPLPYDELLKKGGTFRRGLFGVRHIDDKWYFDIPKALTGRYFLVVTRYTAVPQRFGKYSGEEVGHATLYFERRGDKLLLRSYLETQLADPKDAISVSLKQATVDPIVAAFKIIKGETERDSMLIDVTTFLTRDNHFTGLPSAVKSKQKLGGMMDDRSFVDTVKVYPTNIELAATRTYSTSASTMPASVVGSATIGLNTSIVILPEVPMRKRLWDERVGYFVNRFTLFSDAEQQTENESFISRYRLVPKDVAAYRKGKLVEPVKPIVYYIDPSTPKKWVPYLIEGVKDWNKAFEAAGFKNAITAKEWPNDPDMSLDDARFCVLRYLPAEVENAYGPRIVDPRSGEIIESHICWYHNVMKLLKEWYMIQCAPNDKSAQTMRFSDELMGQLIRFVSSHEVGHTLGLRHNMGASFATPVAKLRDKAWVEQHGHTASIMDYARFNYVAQPQDGISRKGLFPRINDYDLWAIEWGYRYRPEFADEYTERDALKKETTRRLAANARLWFGGEGRTDDPRSQTEDLGDDSVEASDYGIENLKRVVAGLPSWTHQENDDYTYLGQMYRAALKQFKRYMGHVTKNIAARFLNNMPGKKPFEPVPAARQRRAVDYLSRQVFETPLWLYPENIMEKVGMDASKDILTRQEELLQSLLSVNTLFTLANTYASYPEAYSPEAYFNDLFAGVWKPLSASNERKNVFRRALQRSYLERLDALLNPSEKDKAGTGARAFNSDALLYLTPHLEKIERFVQKELSSVSANTLNTLHYQRLLQEIKQIREKKEPKK